jgi:hypothetical protein
VIDLKDSKVTRSESFLIKGMDNFPKELKKQDLFGMGYPYLIAGYGD